MLPNSMDICDYNGKKLSEDDVQDKLKQFRTLIGDNTSLVKLRQDDLYLLRFLHCCEFNVDTSYVKIQEFCKFLIDHKDWVAHKSPENVKTMLHMNFSFALPQVDKDGRRLCLTRLANVNPSKVSMAEYSRITDLWFESILDEPLVQARGISLVVDVSGFSWKILGWMTPSNIRKVVKRLDNIVTREFFIHVVKSSAFTSIGLKIILPLLPAKIKEQMKFHFNDLNSLHQYIDPKDLPKDYGGLLDLDFDSLNRELLQRNDDLAAKLEHHRLIFAEIS